MALALFLLVGGALKIGHASGPYTVDVDRSYALQASALAEQSNEQAGQLNHLVSTMAGLDRRTLGIQLDDLAADAQATAAAAAALAPPSPADGLDQGFATALGDRASAVAEIRGAVDGLLGMTSAATPAAAPGATPAGSAAGTLLPSDQAADRLSRAGSALAQSDQAYASVRRALRLAPGNAALPRSVWVHDPTLWAPGPVQTLVAALTGSASLAADHRLQLVSVQVTPAAVPPLGTPPGGTARGGRGLSATNVSILPPTDRLAVDAVVANFGNVAERGATVQRPAPTPRGGHPGVGVGPGRPRPGGFGGGGPARPAHLPGGHLRAERVGEPAARPGRPERARRVLLGPDRPGHPADDHHHRPGDHHDSVAGDHHHRAEAPGLSRPGAVSTGRPDAP